MNKICKYCNESIEFDKSQQYASHVGNCIMNPNRNNFKINYKLICKKCNSDYDLLLTEYTYNLGKYRKNCSIKCANSRVISDEH